MAISQLDMFFDTRKAVHVTDSDPSNSPNTELNKTPTAATIRYRDGPNRDIDAEEYVAPNGKGFETAMFLIGRAMLDPDATVVPT